MVPLSLLSTPGSIVHCPASTGCGPPGPCSLHQGALYTAQPAQGCGPPGPCSLHQGAVYTAQPAQAVGLLDPALYTREHCTLPSQHRAVGLLDPALYTREQCTLPSQHRLWASWTLLSTPGSRVHCPASTGCGPPGPCSPYQGAVYTAQPAQAVGLLERRKILLLASMAVPTSLSNYMLYCTVLHFSFNSRYLFTAVYCIFLCIVDICFTAWYYISLYSVDKLHCSMLQLPLLCR